MGRKAILSVFYFSILVLSSCVSQASYADSPIEGVEDETIAVLFSDINSVAVENDYYNALLELQQQQPEHFPAIHFVDTDDKKAIEYYNVKQFPTMLVLNGDDVSLRLEGAYSKEEIFQMLKNTLEIAGKTAPMNG